MFLSKFLKSVFNFSELNETTVVMNLKKRYDQELIYVCLIVHIYPCHDHTLVHFLIISFSSIYFQTYIGSILVSVNPYKLLNIYGTDMVLQYASSSLSDNPP